MRICPSRRQLLIAGSTAIGLAATGARATDKWPSKPIRILVGFPAGGQTDVIARAFGSYLAKELGQPVVVENKAGAGGTLAAQELKRAPADGHTLMFAIGTTLILNRLYNKDLGYDADKDFSLLSMIPGGGAPMVAASKLNVNNLAEFVAYARKSEKVNVGTYAPGSFAHMLIDQLNRQFGLKLEAVHYRGEAPMWTDVAGGSIDAGIGSYTAAANVIDSGRGKAIAISRARIGKLPEVRTFREQGTTSRAFDLLTFQSCLAPSATPAETKARLAGLLFDASKDDRVKALLTSFGIEERAMNMEAAQKLYFDELPIWLESARGLEVVPQ